MLLFSPQSPNNVGVNYRGVMLASGGHPNDNEKNTALSRANYLRTITTKLQEHAVCLSFILIFSFFPFFPSHNLGTRDGFGLGTDPRLEGFPNYSMMQNEATGKCVVCFQNERKRSKSTQQSRPIQFNAMQCNRQANKQASSINRH